jgi:putative transposase
MALPNRKTVKHYHEPGDFHELTFSCYRQLPLLELRDFRERLSPHVDRACCELSFHLVAFVFMPEHLHLLINPLLPQPQIDRWLIHLKRPFSAEIKRLLVATQSPLLQRLTVRERPGKYCFRFWQEGPGYDRNINTVKALESSIDYIHMNPVRRGLCERPTDWPWSSARYYLLEPPKQQFVELPFIHGLPSDALM